ncbi:hypothetical protein [Bacillus pseudomycoides]|uniref:hypothetical protein n=1 Tax=Bacillus pseudomycoides TaxID=64104 RepID=UPI003D65F830
MTNEEIRRDSIDIYYAPANRFNKISNFLFYLNLSISFVLLLKLPTGVKESLTIVLIVMTLLYALFSNLTSFRYLPRAEEKRKTHLISNAFQIRMDGEETHLYYNNSLREPISRLGANVLEDTLFSKNVSQKMIFKEISLVGVYIILGIIVCLNRESNLDFILWISQTLFSTVLISNVIKLVVFNKKCECIYEEVYKIFLDRDEISTVKFNAYVLDSFSKYECVKFQCGVMLSSNTFHKLNPSLKQKWEEIKKELKFE